jgi:hypothetical protein
MSLAILDGALARLTEVVDALGADFPPPKLLQYKHVVADRHQDAELSNGLFCFLKAVKICSTLNAAVLLVSKGFAQEAYALCRVAEDQADDIHFLLLPRGKEALSELQERVLAEFFQEEFEDPTEPVRTSQDRDRVSRKKIRAAVNSDAGVDDPSTANAISQMFYRAFSGYVHGAYVHIMELHSDETPGRYLMRGTPRKITEAAEFLPNHVFRAMLAVESLAKVSGRADLLPRINVLRKKFTTEFDLLPEKSVKR